jgi:hypothetical protein
VLTVETLVVELAQQAALPVALREQLVAALGGSPGE